MTRGRCAGRVIVARSGVAVAGRVLLVFGGGFAWFVHQAGQAGEAPPHTDGIVAFTGGPERVETALRLLAEGRADRLLLSGIGGGAELAELAHRAGVDPLPLASRVTIDRSAATTRGNADRDRRLGAGERHPLAAGGDRLVPYAARDRPNWRGRCRR